MLPKLLRVLPLVLVFSVGCDDSAQKKAAADAKAKKEAKEAEEAAALEKRKQERLAKQKAEEDAEAAKQAAIDALCTLPEDAEIPKKLDKACAAVAEAHDGFMNRLYADNAETVAKWNSAKGTQLPMTTGQCTKAGSTKVAACQIHALNTATVELKKELPAMFKTCIDKYGAPPEPKPE